LARDYHSGYATRIFGVRLQLGSEARAVRDREHGVSTRATTETKKRKPSLAEQIVHFSNDVHVAGSSIDRLSLASLERAAAATSAIENATKTENMSKDGRPAVEQQP